MTAPMIDPATFTRLDEVDAYARRAECDRADAIRMLVNTALSMLCHQCNLDIGDYFSTSPRAARYGLCVSCNRARSAAS